MHRYCTFLVSIMCIAIASMPMAVRAQADVQTEDAHFKDWPTVVNDLRSKGIEASRVNWGPIETMCLGLKEQSGEASFNKCKYEKARDQSVHALDWQQCNTRAVAQYPDRLTQAESSETLRETDSTGQIHIYERLVQPLSTTELSSLRNAAIIQCMQTLGWVSADDAFAGKRCE